MYFYDETTAENVGTTIPLMTEKQNLIKVVSINNFERFRCMYVITFDRKTSQTGVKSVI
jgi:hypothetical protein